MKNVKDIKMGRPRKEDSLKLTEVITFKVTSSEKALYDMVAEIQGISISELARITMSKSHKNLDKFVGNLKEFNIKTG